MMVALEAAAKLPRIGRGGCIVHGAGHAVFALHFFWQYTWVGDLAVGGWNKLSFLGDWQRV